VHAARDGFSRADRGPHLANVAARCAAPVYDKSLLLRRPTKSFMFYLWLFLRVRVAHALLARVEKVAAAEFHLRR
jgi:hypothetical protein